MKDTPYISNLTALRGIAALFTVIYHVDMWLGNGGGMLADTSRTAFVERLYLMVDFFFVLSGFIMFHVYGRWFADSVSGAKFRRFTVARLARVYPLHLLTLCVMALIYWGMSRASLPDIPSLTAENNTYSFITNLLLLHSMNLHDWFSWVHASWSISTEWWMYMLFPFLVTPFLRLSLLGQWSVALLCWGGYFAIMYWVLPLVTVPDIISFAKIDPGKMSVNVAYQYGFLRCMFGFMWGMVAYRAYTGQQGRALLGNGTALLLLTAGLVLSLHLGLPDAITVAFFPFMLLAAAYGSAGTDKVLRLRPLQKLGDWSFSIYLVHQPLNLLLIAAVVASSQGKEAASDMPSRPDMLSGWFICVAMVAVTIAVSAMVYRFWENPMRKRVAEKFG